jgi:copper homeostasis protein
VVQTIAVGGLTPAAETVARIRDRVSLPLRVMLRANAGFQTDPPELARLCHAARELRAVGADAFVFGFLTPDGRLDLPALRALADAVAPCPWTLHHAFDHAADARAAWEAARALPGLDLVLSGGGPAGLPAGLPALCERAAWQTDELRWLAGGGLQADAIPRLRRAGIAQFHVGRAARAGGSWDGPVDVQAVQLLRRAIADDTGTRP